MKTKLTSILAMLICIAILIVPLASCDDDGSSVTTTEKPTETSAPDTSAPDTSVPDTSAPDTDSPATGAPETSAPETNAPDTSVPDTNAPETSAPVTSAPDTDAPETSAPTTEDKPVIVDKAGWENMLSGKNFENYTLTMEGRMTVTQDGVDDSTTSDVHEVMKITADKVEIIAYAEDVNSPADDSFTIVVEGEDAEAQKVQISQIFMAILGHYESFVFDPLTGNYTIPETLTIEAVLKGISSSDGEIKTFDVPSTLVIREAIATISADGQLLTFVCDYTQTMNRGGGEISTSGKTTWTFSDYGTTVIE